MAAHLIEPTEPIVVRQLCCLIYGQPGSRKSSLAQTAEEPITLAFDPGIYRAYGRKAAVLFDTWADVISFNLSPYKTIVVDTIGMCLEKLAAAIIADNPKHGNRMGGLSLQGYGVLKEHFKSWVASIRQRGQHLVFTAHEKAEKNGDESYYCPDIVGGSYSTVMNVADLVGYMHYENGKRVLDFNPTDRWMAKAPPCGWGQIALPDFSTQPQFLSGLITQARESMGKISAASAEIATVVEDYQILLDSDPNLEDFNTIAKGIATLTNGTKKQVWHLILTHAEKVGWTFDKADKVFVKKEASHAQV